MEDIDHSRTKTKSPRTNGICERFHKTVLNEFYPIAFRKKLYASIADLQNDLDLWVRSYNEERPHQGRWCFGKTPMQTFLDPTPIAKEIRAVTERRFRACTTDSHHDLPIAATGSARTSPPNAPTKASAACRPPSCLLQTVA